MLLTVTLNASVDKAYYINHAPKIGDVNRVKRVINTAGGKGLNATRAIMACGGSVLATGFVGGFNGQYFLSLLDADGVSHDFVKTAGETRCCINALDEGSSTEFLEAGSQISDEELDKFSNHYKNLLSTKSIDAVIISGSVPTGVPADYYATLINTAKQSNVDVFFDSSGDLLKNAIAQKPHFIKPNLQEANDLTGKIISSKADAAQAAMELASTGIDIVCITLGADGAIITDGNQSYCSVVDDPSGNEVVNTVGCGDTFVGTFALCQTQGKNLKDSFEFALAASRSNAMSQKTGFCDLNEVKKYLNYTKTTQI